MSKNTMRGIFIFIILATIPCYLIAFVVWFFEVQEYGALPTDPPPIVSETFTPIVPEILLTNNALTSSPPATQILFTQPFATSTATIPPATLPPTILPTATAFIPTQAPTLPPLSTATPTIPPPILLPPSDTPAP